MCHLPTRPIESGPQEEILKSQCNLWKIDFHTDTIQTKECKIITA